MRARAPVAAVLCCVVTLSLMPGCADPGKTTPPNYRPVLTIKTRAPQPVDVRPLTPAKKDLAQASQFVRDALADELANAGFTVTRSPESAAAAPSTATAQVGGTLEEYRSDIGMGGYRTRMRVKLVVTRRGSVKLDKEFAVDEGGSGLTGSRHEFETVTRSALTTLMRRAVPEVIAVIEQ